MRESQPATPEPKPSGGFRQKLSALWADDRSFKQRLWLCLLPPLALCYTLLFFGPIELYCANPNAVRYSLGDLALAMGALAIAAFVLMAGVLLLLRGKVLNLAAGLLFGLALCCYVQGNFLNLDLGVLDGEAIPWQNYAAWSGANLILWALLLALPLAVLYFSRTGFSRLVCFGGALLVAMQTVALVTLLPGAPKISRDYYHIDSETIFEVSSKQNTIVFILDRFPAELMDSVLEMEPTFTDTFKDFTWFENYSSDYLSTYPAVTTMLSGHKYDGTEPALEYLDNAWASDTAGAFYGRLREAGFTNKLYINPRYTLGQGVTLSQQVDNIKQDTLGIDHVGLAKTMTKLSAYRYAPHAMKASLWMETEDLGGTRGDIIYSNFYNENFIKDLGMQGLRTQEENNAFMVYHIKGAHSPYVLDEDMNHVEGGTSWERNATGVVRIVATYLEMLDSLGLYEDANIIITTDHGDRDHLAALFMAKQSGQQNDTLATSSAPTCADDLLPTILYMNGLPYEDLGQPVYAFSEGEERQRFFTPLAESGELPPTGGNHNALAVYPVPQNARDLDIRGEHTFTPLVDSFY